MECAFIMIKYATAMVSHAKCHETKRMRNAHKKYKTIAKLKAATGRYILKRNTKSLRNSKNTNQLNHKKHSYTVNISRKKVAIRRYTQSYATKRTVPSWKEKSLNFIQKNYGKKNVALKIHVIRVEKSSVQYKKYEHSRNRSHSAQRSRSTYLFGGETLRAAAPPPPPLLPARPVYSQSRISHGGFNK